MTAWNVRLPTGRIGALFATAGAQRGATPGVVRLEKGVEGLRRSKFPERDSDPSFKFYAVIEEFETKRRSGHPMLRPVSVVPERGLKETEGRLAESGRVGTSVPDERISALEESLRQMQARWSAKPIAVEMAYQDRMLPRIENHSRRVESADYRESTPVGFTSSGYGSLRRRPSRGSGSVSWETPETRDLQTDRFRSTAAGAQVGIRFAADDSSSGEVR